MLKTKRLTEVTTCAICRGTISLVQINGKTIPVEVEAGYLGQCLIVLAPHLCEIPGREGRGDLVTGDSSSGSNAPSAGGRST